MALRRLTGAQSNIPYQARNTGGIFGTPVQPSGPTQGSSQGPRVDSPGLQAMFQIEDAPPGYTIDDIIRDVVEAGGTIEDAKAVVAKVMPEEGSDYSEQDWQDSWAKSYNDRMYDGGDAPAINTPTSSGDGSYFQDIPQDVAARPTPTAPDDSSYFGDIPQDVASSVARRGNISNENPGGVDLDEKGLLGVSNWGQNKSIYNLSGAQRNQKPSSGVSVEGDQIAKAMFGQDYGFKTTSGQGMLSGSRGNSNHPYGVAADGYLTYKGERVTDPEKTQQFGLGFIQANREGSIGIGSGYMSPVGDKIHIQQNKNDYWSQGGSKYRNGVNIMDETNREGYVDDIAAARRGEDQGLFQNVAVPKDRPTSGSLVGSEGISRGGLLSDQLEMLGPDASPAWQEVAKEDIRKNEGFKTKAYKDYNSSGTGYEWRVGYGTDTVTNPDGSTSKVTKNTTVTRDQAERDLDRRVSQEFGAKVQQVMGPEGWATASPQMKAALTSVAYNYGSLPSSVAKAVRGGDYKEVARAVGDLSANKSRRKSEAASILSGGPSSTSFQAATPTDRPDPTVANLNPDLPPAPKESSINSLAEANKFIDDGRSAFAADNLWSSFENMQRPAYESFTSGANSPFTLDEVQEVEVLGDPEIEGARGVEPLSDPTTLNQGQGLRPHAGSSGPVNRVEPSTNNFLSSDDLVEAIDNSGIQKALQDYRRGLESGYTTEAGDWVPPDPDFHTSSPTPAAASGFSGDSPPVGGGASTYTNDSGGGDNYYGGYSSYGNQNAPVIGTGYREGVTQGSTRSYTPSYAGRAMSNPSDGSAELQGLLGTYNVPSLPDDAWGVPTTEFNPAMASKFQGLEGIKPLEKVVEEPKPGERRRVDDPKPKGPRYSSKVMDIIRRGQAMPLANSQARQPFDIDMRKVGDAVKKGGVGGLLAGNPIAGAAIGGLFNAAKQAGPQLGGLLGGSYQGMHTGGDVPALSRGVQLGGAYDVYGDRSGRNTWAVSNGDSIVSRDGSTGWTSVTSNVSGKGPVTTLQDIHGSVGPNRDPSTMTPIWGGKGDGIFGNGDTEGEQNKIVCTAMNQSYGFGGFRNAIWLKYAKDNLTPYHQTGYHALFLPLVNLGYKKNNKFVRSILEHIARHRSVDLRAEMKGSKRDTLGRIYRAILEPTCYLVGRMIGDKK